MRRQQKLELVVTAAADPSERARLRARSDLATFHASRKVMAGGLRTGLSAAGTLLTLMVGWWSWQDSRWLVALLLCGGLLMRFGGEWLAFVALLPLGVGLALAATGGSGWWTIGALALGVGNYLATVREIEHQTWIDEGLDNVIRQVRTSAERGRHQ